jgi:hypothetical protein
MEWLGGDCSVSVCSLECSPERASEHVRAELDARRISGFAVGQLSKCSMRAMRVTRRVLREAAMSVEGCVVWEGGIGGGCGIEGVGHSEWGDE